MDKNCNTCLYDVNAASWCNSCIRNPKGKFDAWTSKPSLETKEVFAIEHETQCKHGRGINDGMD